jgi:hypothetical protein
MICKGVEKYLYNFKLMNEKKKQYYFSGVIKQFYLVGEIRNEMGGTYSTHGNMRNSCKILVENLKERDCLADLGAAWKKLLKCILMNRV